MSIGTATKLTGELSARIPEYDNPLEGHPLFAEFAPEVITPALLEYYHYAAPELHSEAFPEPTPRQVVLAERTIKIAEEVFSRLMAGKSVDDKYKTLEIAYGNLVYLNNKDVVSNTHWQRGILRRLLYPGRLRSMAGRKNVGPIVEGKAVPTGSSAVAA